MLDFYDELRRRQRTVRRFAGALFEQLGGERGTDRGSEGLIHQTCFLGFSFLAYERAVRASGAMDEHTLRAALLAHQGALPVLAPRDRRGRSPVRSARPLAVGLRFDRPPAPASTRLDVVVTDGLHDIGFRERLEAELPGIEEDRWTATSPRPVLLRPPDAGDERDPLCFVSRDREEELRDVARSIRHRAVATGGRLAEATAIVFHRPLPYLYLSQQVLTEARVPYQAFDALPLAAEPYAALLDVVMTAARTGVTREPAVEVLRSGLLQFAADGVPVTGRDVSWLNEALSERRAVGEAGTFEAEVRAWFAGRGRRAPLDDVEAHLAGAVRASRAAAGVAAALAAFRAGARRLSRSARLPHSCGSTSDCPVPPIRGASVTCARAPRCSARSTRSRRRSLATTTPRGRMRT